MEVTINYFAVLLAGVANMVVGFLWYGPLFGKMWKGMMGFTDESIKSMPMKPMTSMVWGLVVSFVMAYVLAYFMGMLGIMDLGSAMKLACLIWVGFLATNTIGSYLWEGKPLKLFILNAAQQFVAIHVMAAVLFWMM